MGQGELARLNVHLGAGTMPRGAGCYNVMYNCKPASRSRSHRPLELKGALRRRAAERLMGETLSSGRARETQALKISVDVKSARAASC